MSQPLPGELGLQREARVAVVTGAASGIGAAVTQALAQAGWVVAAAGRRRHALDALVETSERDGIRSIRPVVADVTDESSVSELFATVAEDYGRVDLLFNNAGIFGPRDDIGSIALDDWDAVVRTNVTGVFLCTREAIRMMRSQQPQGGRIINNGSISAHTPRPLAAAYTTTKHAITGLTKATALDGRSINVACGQIDIGNAATAMTETMSSAELQADGQYRPEPLMDVGAVAQAVVYMASLPLDANVANLTVMATKMPFVGRG